MKKYLIISILILILITLIAGGYMWWKKSNKNSKISEQNQTDQRDFSALEWKDMNFNDLPFIVDEININKWQLDTNSAEKSDDNLYALVFMEPPRKHDPNIEDESYGDLFGGVHFVVEVKSFPVSTYDKNNADQPLNFISPPQATEEELSRNYKKNKYQEDYYIDTRNNTIEIGFGKKIIEKENNLDITRILSATIYISEDNDLLNSLNFDTESALDKVANSFRFK